jgi:hypothetical protein
MKLNNVIIPVAIAAVVAGGGGFFGGMKYDASQTSNKGGQFQNFANMTAEQRQTFQQRGGVNGAALTRRAQGGNMIGGEILSKDDKSITVKDAAGGSKIIFLSPSTTISKMTDGTTGDLAVGKNVTVNGTANSDGSIAAQSIQLRPAMTVPSPKASPEQ